MTQATRTRKTIRTSGRRRTKELRPAGTRRLADPVVEFDLPRITEKLRAEPAWKTEGHNAATIVKYPDLRIVLLALQGKAVMREHRADARISVQTLTGHARLRLPDRVVDLPAGRGVALERGLLHDVEAIEESALLLTLSWAPERQKRR